jgi:2-dehydropantoate 2-reductase
MQQLHPVMTERTVLLTLQNGVDTEERLAAGLPCGSVVGGVAYIYSKIVEPGVIDHYKRGAVAIGEMSGPRTDRVTAIAELFTQAGIPCQIVDDVRRSKWEKMCWNCVFNPLTVLINDRVAKAIDHPDMLTVIGRIVDEVVAVAAACGVPLAGDMSKKVIRWSEEIRDIHTSMYDDWKAGRQTEIDSLNGYIVARGHELGIPTPLNEALTVMIKVVTERERTGPDVVRIDGAVIQPVVLDQAGLSKLPADMQVPDVGARTPGMKGRGVTLKGLLSIPALMIDADHVVFHAAGNQFSACLTLQQAREYGVLVYEVDGHPLPRQNGGPYRLITPGLGDLCANVKGVGRIELRVGPVQDSRPSTRTC